MGWKAELLKNWRARASAACLVLTIIVLIDELVKEGYTIDLHDLTVVSLWSCGLLPGLKFCSGVVVVGLASCLSRLFVGVVVGV
jgi:hypothetical protein